MKVLIGNTSDLQGGAHIATYRLHNGLRAIGVDSTMIVQLKRSDDHSVLGPKTKKEKVYGLVKSHFDTLATKFYPDRQQQHFTSAFMPDSFMSRVREMGPDIVHLFYVADYIRIETLKKVGKPIVWTFHDMWAFTGGCHYDGECGRYKNTCGCCPVLQSKKENDLSNRNWKRKSKAWSGLNMTVVATSHWLADCARSSSLFCNSRIEVLPNGLSENWYKPVDKSVARLAYNLPLDKKLLLFPALSATSDLRKGFRYLLAAIQKLSKSSWHKDTELVIVGSSRPRKSIEFGIKAHYIPRLYDEISQILLYSAADVVVTPSVQENLSNTVIESLACGVPVVAFDIGGMPDMIQHKGNGFLVEPFSVDNLAHGIEWVIKDEHRREQLSNQARASMIDKYGLVSIAKRYRELYQDILG